uniref:Glycosyl hydrolase family 38 C-terminal domain-containing protein n=1 Tax=Chenopodium quinoa TaxID=63459 RepID=A0A803LR44_CHEQI
MSKPSSVIKDDDSSVTFHLSFHLTIRDHRTDWELEVSQPIAGNYYPINLGIYLEDENKELSVLVDRAIGGSSIMDGQIELMLHRRLLHDDARGVGEVLNETVCALDDCKGSTIKGKYFFKIDPIGEGAKWRRSYSQEIYSPLIFAFAEQDGDDWMSSHVPTFTGLASSYSLPDNVAIITLQELDNGKVLLRLAHLYEIIKVTETSLSANQERAEMEKRRLAWKVENSSGKETKVSRGGPVDPVELVVELAPMEIRTFLVDLEYIKMFGA